MALYESFPDVEGGVGRRLEATLSVKTDRHISQLLLEQR